MATFGPPFVNTANLADGSVTSAKIALDTVVAADVAANAIGDSEIAAHTTTKITSPFSLVTGTVPIAQGGTGQTTQTAAYDALSPNTTQGDITYFNGTDNVRLGPGTSGQFLKTNGAGANPTWATGGAPFYIRKTGAATWTTVASVTSFINFDDAASFNSTEPFGTAAPTAGTIRNLRAKMTTNNGGIAVLTLRKNGVNTSVTVTSNDADGPQTYADTTNSATVVAGDDITLGATNNGSSTKVFDMISFEYAAN